MSKYDLILKLPIDCREDEDYTEKQLVKTLEKLYKEDRHELISMLVYYLEDKKDNYTIEIKKVKNGSK